MYPDQYPPTPARHFLYAFPNNDDEISNQAKYDQSREPWERLVPPT